MESQILTQLGLTDSQAKIYLAILNNGVTTPPEAAALTNEARTNSYMILDQLCKLGLIEQKSDTKKVSYIALSPTRLKQLHLKKIKSLNSIGTELSAILPGLINKFKLTHKQPGVVQADGLEALQMIHKDILNEPGELWVLPSKNDRDDKIIADEIDLQIEKQAKAGVESHIIENRVQKYNYDPETLTKNGIKIHHSIDFTSNAQIMVYGNSVAFTTYKDGVSSTVITGAEIAGTLREIFKQLAQNSDAL
jgi:sugar-specific transcriptional regulator TrmB